jgi:hypothetical protein
MRETYEEEERCEDETENERACEIRIVHDSRVDAPQRVHHRQALLEDVVEVDAEFCSCA